MTVKVITLDMLQTRLRTVEDKLFMQDKDGKSHALHASIDGRLISLTVDNFQIDDSGTILFLTV